jgi:hypothetical protein
MVIYLVAGGIALKCLVDLHTQCMGFPIDRVALLLSVGSIELVAEIYGAIKVFRSKDK